MHKLQRIILKLLNYYKDYNGFHFVNYRISLRRYIIEATNREDEAFDNPDFMQSQITGAIHELEANGYIIAHRNGDKIKRITISKKGVEEAEELKSRHELVALNEGWH